MQSFANTPRSCVELYTRAHAEGDEEDEVEEEDKEGPELDSSGNTKFSGKLQTIPPSDCFSLAESETKNL